MLLHWAAVITLAPLSGPRSGLLAPRRIAYRLRQYPSRSANVAWLSFKSRKMPPGPSDKTAEKSYLSSAVDSINPWAIGRSATSTPDSKRDEPPAASEVAGDASGDHSVKPLYGQSFKTYPRDCPPLSVQWFHAVDVRRALAAPSPNYMLIN